MRNVLRWSLAFAICAPSILGAQAPAAAARGCPPPPIGEVAALPDTTPLFAAVPVEIPITRPADGWEMGRISWVAEGPGGLTYLLQRGDKAEPIVAVNREGRVVGSWGKGLFTVPHGIRLDRDGNVWTTDASTSIVRKFSSDGKLLLTIDVGGVPGACEWPTRGTTDVAVAANGNIYVADGYANSRIVVYSADGKKLREWGSRGTGRGEFVLPHSIVIDDKGIVYVADRENGRVQRFTLDGAYIGEWFVGGKPFTLALDSRSLLVDVRMVDSAKVARPTLVRINLDSGLPVGRVIMPGGHGISATRDGTELLVPSGAKLFVLPLKR